MFQSLVTCLTHTATQCLRNLPSTNRVIGVSSIQSLSIIRPGKGEAVGLHVLCRGLGHDLWLQLINHVLRFEILITNKIQIISNKR